MLVVTEIVPDELSIRRFWAKVDKSDDCWTYNGTITMHGYGQFWLHRTKVGAHRFSYTITYGKIPDGLLVLHRCDNRPCVRPTHLFLGTYEDNVIDMMSKNRHRVMSGEQHHNSKLTDEKVMEMVQLHKNGVPGRQIAFRYGVDPMTVSDILRGKAWKHVTNGLVTC